MLIRKFSKTPYKDAADTLKRAVKHAEGNELISIGVEKEDAKVILSSRTIVVPDSPKWQENLNGVNKADILLYNVKFIGRDNCSIIKKVGMKFPLDEPPIFNLRVDKSNYFIRILCVSMATFCIGVLIWGILYPPYIPPSTSSQEFKLLDYEMFLSYKKMTFFIGACYGSCLTSILFFAVILLKIALTGTIKKISSISTDE